MARHLLPALTLLFALPAGAMIWQGQDLSRVFAAVAAPTASGARVTTVVTVRVRPGVVIGPRPQVQPLPLPNYSSARAGSDRFRIVMTAELPYTVALVELDAGPLLVGRLVDVPPVTDEVGLRVEAVFPEVADGIRLLNRSVFLAGDDVLMGFDVAGAAP